MSVYISIFILLLTGFGILFYRIRWLETVSRLMKQTVEEIDEATRRRLLADRKKLQMLQQEHTGRYRLEQELYYCGWKRRFPILTAEIWLVSNILILSGVFVLSLVLGGGLGPACMAVIVVVVVEYLLMKIGNALEFRSVNDNLLEFLNFLGNYSITAGEVTGIFNQISKYVREPLKSALAQCSFEAQTTGDAGLALLAMAEKIGHPKFKEIVLNLEVSIRYCADFKVLVDTARRSVREYLRMCEEQKSMLREAVINMLLLLVMSVIALITVDGLIERSVWEILFATIPGKAALTIVAVICVLLLRKLLGLR